MKRATSSRAATSSKKRSRQEARTTIVTAANDAVDSDNVNPAYRRIASYDALSPSERALAPDITDQMIKDLRPEADFIDVGTWAERHPAAFRRLSELTARGDREAVFVTLDKP